MQNLMATMLAAMKASGQQIPGAPGTGTHRAPWTGAAGFQPYGATPADTPAPQAGGIVPATTAGTLPGSGAVAPQIPQQGTQVLQSPRQGLPGMIEPWVLQMLLGRQNQPQGFVGVPQPWMQRGVV